MTRNEQIEKKEVFISVVTPVFNEQDGVEIFYQTIKETLDLVADKWEVICVDDGSQDNTLDNLTGVYLQDKRVKVVVLSRNFGKEIALTAGLDVANGDVIVPIDFDLQDPPELIPKMLALWAEDYDVVYATRVKREGESWFKKVTASIFYKLISKMSNVDIPTDTGDFRLIDRKVLDSLKELKETHRFMKGLFAWVGYSQISLPYVRKPRAVGDTKWGYWKLWNFAIEGITGFSITPLQLATYLGFMISLSSFLYALFTVSKTLILGVDVPGYASLLIAILFLGGVQLVFLGIMGEYIGRIYNEVKRRPLYIVDNKLGVED